MHASIKLAKMTSFTRTESNGKKWFVFVGFRQIRREKIVGTLWFLVEKTIEKPQLNGAAHSLNYHNFTARLNKNESNEMQHLQCISNIRLLSAANLSQTDFMFCIFFCSDQKRNRFRRNVKTFDIWNAKMDLNHRLRTEKRSKYAEKANR